MKRRNVGLSEGQKDAVERARREFPKDPRRKIDVAKALELRFKGLSYEEITKHFGVRKSSVHVAFKPFRDIEPDLVNAFELSKSKPLAMHQIRSLMHLTDEKLKEATALQLATTFGVLYDKQRLQDGKSTSNTSSYVQIVTAACDKDTLLVPLFWFLFLATKDYKDSKNEECITVL